MIPSATLQLNGLMEFCIYSVLSEQLALNVQGLTSRRWYSVKDMSTSRDQASGVIREPSVLVMSDDSLTEQWSTSPFANRNKVDPGIKLVNENHFSPAFVLVPSSALERRG